MANYSDFFRKHQSWLVWAAAALLMAIPLFGHLDELPLLTWDELRNAQNALEMNRNGNLIVTHVSGHPETWNTKPPLLTWILALTQRTMGYNELAVRLPSAVAAALTGFYILGLAKRHTGRWQPGLLALIVLITAGGYVSNHGTRTGDYDALLTLFVVLAAGCFLDYHRSGRGQALLLCMLALTGAVMTKGVAGLFITPALLGVAIWLRSLRRILRSGWFWAGAAAFLLIVGGYYLRRESLQPGYLQLVWDNELGGRYGTALETHKGDFWQYWRWLREVGLSCWYLLLLPAAFAAVLSREEGWRRLGVMSLACMLSIMLIISSSATKLGWYMLPAYPFMALLCGMFLDQACRVLTEWPWAKTFWRWNFLPAVLLIALAVPAYFGIAQSSMDAADPYTPAGTHDAGVYLKDVVSGRRELGANTVCGDHYPLIWYMDVLKAKGTPVTAADSTVLRPGMDVMLWEDVVKARVKARYRWSQKEQFRSVEIIRIESARSDTVLIGGTAVQ